MRALVLGAVAALLFASVGVSQESAPSPDTLRAITLRVADLELRRQLASATPATIDSLLALYSDSVVYEHPNAGAVIRGKDVMRRNMRQFIGTVRSIRSEPSRVTIGHGVAVVETSAQMQVDDRGTWVDVVRHGIRVLEFDQRGLVRRILDYPW